MKYEIETELTKLKQLLGKEAGENKHLHELCGVLARNLQVIITLDPKTEFYRYMDVLLGAIINTNLSTKDKFKEIYNDVISQGKREKLEDIAEKVKLAMENLWNLFYKRSTVFPHFKESYTPKMQDEIDDYISDLMDAYEQEKINHYGELLHAAGESDIKAMLRGERLEAKDQFSYQIAQKIKKRQI